jgi:hypothetical protein
LSFYFIQNKPASLTDIGVLNDAMANTSDAIHEYLHLMVRSVVLTTMMFLPVFFRIIRNKNRISFLFLAAPLSLLACMYVLIFTLKGEPAIVGFPKGYSFGFGTVAQKINALIETSNHHRLEIVSVDTQPIKKIIVIIDESIEYKEFRDTQTEPLKSVVDYGQAYSGANCSASSNFILRRSGWIRENATTNSIQINHIMSLFALAKKANYQVTYLDNQNNTTDTSVNNYLDKEELSHIDTLIGADGEIYKRDNASLKEIETLLKNPKVFIFINKVGAHFPYDATIPPSHRKADRISNYRNSLQLNSHLFLKNLSTIIDQDTLVFYTSDHGQNIHGRTSHCSTGDETPFAEYSVPFQVVTKNVPFFNKLDSEKHLYANKLTHLEFSESIRNSMGYGVNGIDSIYKKPQHLNIPFCGVYGPPKPTFGSLPKCKLLPNPVH